MSLLRNFRNPWEDEEEVIKTTSVSDKIFSTNTDFQKFNIYILDDTKSYSSSSIKKMIFYAEEIFIKNRFPSEYFQYSLITHNELSNKLMGPGYMSNTNDLFLAIITSLEGETNVRPGLSEIVSGYTVVNNLSSEEYPPWNSFVNTRPFHDHSNPNYSIGYTIAHETLHQMYSTAYFYFYKKDINTHLNHIDNLNASNTIKNISQRFLKDGYQNKLRQHEVILAEQKKLIINYVVSINEKYWKKRRSEFRHSRPWISY